MPAAAKDEARRLDRRPARRPAGRRASGLGPDQPADGGGGARRTSTRWPACRSTGSGCRGARTPRWCTPGRRADRAPPPPVARDRAWPAGGRELAGAHPLVRDWASARRTSPPTCWSPSDEGLDWAAARVVAASAPPGWRRRSRACGRDVGDLDGLRAPASAAAPRGSSAGRWSTRRRSRSCTRCTRPRRTRSRRPARSSPPAPRPEPAARWPPSTRRAGSSTRPSSRAPASSSTATRRPDVDRDPRRPVMNHQVTTTRTRCSTAGQRGRPPRRAGPAVLHRYAVLAEPPGLPDDADPPARRHGPPRRRLGRERDHRDRRPRRHARRRPVPRQPRRAAARRRRRGPAQRAGRSGSSARSTPRRSCSPRRPARRRRHARSRRSCPPVTASAQRTPAGGASTGRYRPAAG